MNTAPSITHLPSLHPYELIYQKMKDYTQTRTEDSSDAIWLLEHSPVFTQGQAGKAEHILDAGNIPIVQSDRGGQVTYHGPGQLMIYTLCDIKRVNVHLKAFVNNCENLIITLLKSYGLSAQQQSGAPGVYIDGAKICSIGLRIRKGCTYHGMSFNVNMDLSPFSRINPCGFRHLKMTQLNDHIPDIQISQVVHDLTPLLENTLL